MKKQFLLILLSLGLPFFGYAQKKIYGQINDRTGQSISGVNVLEKGTSNGTATDFYGKFNINVKSSESVLVISSLGFKTTEIKASNDSPTIVLQEEGVGLEEVNIQALGSRNTKRTVVNSAVPIDVINVRDVTTQSGKIEINELLQYVDRKSVV